MAASPADHNMGMQPILARCQVAVSLAIVFMVLEAHGFCKPGEASDFIASGEIEIGGSLPVNTNGGLLGEAYIHGMNNIVEGVRQIRGTAANQLPHAETVMVAGGRSGLILQPAD